VAHRSRNARARRPGPPTRTQLDFEAVAPAGGVDAEPKADGSARFEHPAPGGVDAEPQADGSARFEHPAAGGVDAEPKADGSARFEHPAPGGVDAEPQGVGSGSKHPAIVEVADSRAGFR
jgi:hypothetical protein